VIAQVMTRSEALRRRFASLLDGLYESWLDDPDFRPIVDRDLADGQHRNRDTLDRPGFFTTAYFHPPAWPPRWTLLASLASPSTGSKDLAGRCARNGPTGQAASRSCPRLTRPRPDSLSPASAATSSRPPQSHGADRPHDTHWRTQISLLSAAWTACRQTVTGAPNGGYLRTRC